MTAYYKDLHGVIRFGNNNWQNGHLQMTPLTANECECRIQFAAGNRKTLKINRKNVNTVAMGKHRFQIVFHNGPTLYYKNDSSCSNHPCFQLVKRIKDGKPMLEEKDHQMRHFKTTYISKTPPRNRNLLSNDSPSPLFTSVKENLKKKRDGDVEENAIKDYKSVKYLNVGTSKADQLLSERKPNSFYGKSPPNQQNYIGKTTTKQTYVVRKPGYLESPRKRRLIENGNYSWSRHSAPVQVQKTALQGFSNLGNTCYMNAILQSLCALVTFAADLSSANKQIMKEAIMLSRDSLYFTLNRLVQAKKNQLELSSVNKASLLQEVKKAICGTAKRFSGFQQHDAHEFLVLVLDQLKEEIEKEGCKLFRLPNKLDKNEDPDVIKRRKKHFLNPTVMNFEFEVLHTIKCGSCHHELKNVEVLDALSIDLPKKKDAPRSIQDAIDIYFANEEIEYNCEKCGCKESTVTNKCLRLPRIMVLHLKRYNSTSIYKKIDQRVKIPSFLTLRKQCTDETSPCYPFPMSFPAELSSESPPRKKNLSHSDGKTFHFKRGIKKQGAFDHLNRKTVVKELLQCNAVPTSAQNILHGPKPSPDRHENTDDEMASAIQRQLYSSPKNQKFPRGRSSSFGEISHIEDMSEEDQLKEAIAASKQSKLEYDRTHNQSSIEMGRNCCDDEVYDDIIFLDEEAAVTSHDQSSAVWHDHDIEERHYSGIKPPRSKLTDTSPEHNLKRSLGREFLNESGYKKTSEAHMYSDGANDIDENDDYTDVPQLDGVGDPFTERKSNEPVGSCLQFKVHGNMKTYGSKPSHSAYKKDEFEAVLHKDDPCKTVIAKSRKRPSSTTYQVLNKSFCESKGDCASSTDEEPLKERPSLNCSTESRIEGNSDMEIDEPSPPQKDDLQFSFDDKENLIPVPEFGTDEGGADTGSSIDKNKEVKEKSLPKPDFGTENWDADTAASTDKNKEDEDLQRALQLSLKDEEELLNEAIELSLMEYNQKNFAVQSKEGNETDCDIESPDIERSEEEEKELEVNAETGELPYSYRLVSVVSHLGNSSTVGHYISDVFDTRKKCWYSYNDDEVIEKSEQSVKDGRQRNGYLFFYISKDLLEELENDIIQTLPPRSASR